MTDDVPGVDEVPDRDRVWFQHDHRWHPGVLETWSHERRAAHCWIRYIAPIDGESGGWYSSAWLEQGPCPDNPGLSWDAAATRADLTE